MKFAFTVEVEVERVSGKFASRDEIGESIENAMDNDLGSIELSGLGADGESEYEVTNVTITAT